MNYRKSVYWALPVIWGLGIVYLSLLPAGAGVFKLFGVPHIDKVAHIGAYGVWSFLLLYASLKVQGYNRKRMWWFVFALCIVGFGLEVGQYSLHQGRSFEIWDMVANGLGSIGGIFAIAFQKRIQKRK